MAQVRNDERYGTRDLEAQERLEQLRREAAELREVFEKGIAALNRHAEEAQAPLRK